VLPLLDRWSVGQVGQTLTLDLLNLRRAAELVATAQLQLFPFRTRSLGRLSGPTIALTGESPSCIAFALGRPVFVGRSEPELAKLREHCPLSQAHLVHVPSSSFSSEREAVCRMDQEIRHRIRFHRSHTFWQPLERPIFSSTPHRSTLAVQYD
jgi:hypothetical protein